jgi:hypothetical protein
MDTEVVKLLYSTCRVLGLGLHRRYGVLLIEFNFHRWL